MKKTLSINQNWFQENASLQWPAIIFLSVIALSIVKLSSILAPLRPFVVFWFLLVCPGMAFVRLLRLKDREFVFWTLAIPLSLALDALIAGLMVYTGRWSPPHGLVVLVVISLLGALLQVAAARGK